MLLGKSSAYREILAADKTEARLVLAGLWLLLLLPIMLIFARAGAEISSGLISILFLYHSWRSRDWTWLKQAPVIIAFALWLYSVLIVSPNAIDPRASFGRADWIRFIPLFAAIVYWLSDYPRELMRIAQVMAIVMVISGLDGIYQYLTGFSLAGVPYVKERLTGPFSKVVIGIYTAKLSLPFIGLLLYYAWVDHQKWMKQLLMLLLMYCFGLIILSNERTATLTFAVSLVLLAGGFFAVFSQSRRTILSLIALVLAGMIAAYATQPALQKRLYVTHDTIENFSNSEYAQLWKASILLWQEHPVTGVGMVNFRIACPKLLEEGKVLYCNAHSHNIYLEVLSEFGTLGFMLLLTLIMSLFTIVIEEHSSHPPARYILTFFALAGLVINFFPLAPTQSFFSNWPALLAWQSIAWSLALMRAGREPKHG